MKLSFMFFCVGGFQRAVTKAGSVLYLCTKWMPEKMPTPTCSQRKRPATCTKYNVGIKNIFYSLINDGIVFFKLGTRAQIQVNMKQLHYIRIKCVLF